MGQSAAMAHALVVARDIKIHGGTAIDGYAAPALRVLLDAEQLPLWPSVDVT